VPALITDDGAVIGGSRPIMEWAAEHPAPDRATTDAAA
jgi:glutathione S-transferase